MTEWGAFSFLKVCLTHTHSLTLTDTDRHTHTLKAASPSTSTQPLCYSTHSHFTAFPKAQADFEDLSLILECFKLNVHFLSDCRDQRQSEKQLSLTQHMYKKKASDQSFRVWRILGHLFINVLFSGQTKGMNGKWLLLHIYSQATLIVTPVQLLTRMCCHTIGWLFYCLNRQVKRC